MKAGEIGAIRIGRREKRAARAEGSIHVELDRLGGDEAVLADAPEAALGHHVEGGAIDGVVDAHRDFAGGGHGIERGHVRTGGRHVVNAGPAEAGLALHRLGVGGADLRVCWRGHQRAHGVHGVVDQHAGGQALRVDFDAAAGGLCGGLAIEAGGFEGRRIGDERVAVGAFDDCGAITRDSVEVLPGGHAFFGPVGFDPAAADQRLACGKRFCGFADDADDFGQRGCLVEVQRLLALANAIEVCVGVGEAGIEEGAGEVDLLGALTC